MSLKELDLLIEYILKEREYVSGSRMPTRPAQEKEDFKNPMIHKVTNHSSLKAGLFKMSQVCSFVELVGNQKFLDDSFSSKFKRMIAAEMMHKFLTTTITDRGVLGYDSRQAGFAMEKMLASFLGGQVIEPNMKGARYTNIADVRFGQLSYSVKFYSRNSISKHGFGQKFSTIYGWWNQNKKNNKPLRYLILVKESEENKVGFTVFEAIIPREQLNKIVKERIGDETDYFDQIVADFKKEKPDDYNKVIEDIPLTLDNKPPDYFQKAKALSKSDEFNKFFNNKIYGAKSDQQDKFYTGEMPIVQTEPGTPPRTDQVPQEDDNIVDLSFNKFEAIAKLMMPVSIDDFLSQSFQEVGKEIEKLYTSLDNFKDSLEEHYLSDRQNPEVVNKKFKSLEQSFEEAFNEKKQEIT